MTGKFEPPEMWQKRKCVTAYSTQWIIRFSIFDAITNASISSTSFIGFTFGPNGHTKNLRTQYTSAKKGHAKMGEVQQTPEKVNNKLGWHEVHTTEKDLEKGYNGAAHPSTCQIHFRKPMHTAVGTALALFTTRQQKRFPSLISEILPRLTLCTHAQWPPTRAAHEAKLKINPGQNLPFRKNPRRCLLSDRSKHGNVLLLRDH